MIVGVFCNGQQKLAEVQSFHELQSAAKRLFSVENAEMHIGMLLLLANVD
jgi:hypothetical protein